MENIKLPKYITIEIKEFPFKPKYSGDPFAEFKEFCDEINPHNDRIREFCISKVGNNFINEPHSSWTNILLCDGSKQRINYDLIYYSADYKIRVFVDQPEDTDDATVYVQTATT